MDDRIVGKVGQNFRAAAFRKIGGNEHKMQFAFAAAERVATNQQNARFQDEGEEALDGFGRNGVAHDFGARTSVRFSGKMLVALEFPVALIEKLKRHECRAPKFV